MRTALPKPVHLLIAGLFLLSLSARSETPGTQLLITSIALQGTNLNFHATVPTGTSQLEFDIRPTLGYHWQPALSIPIPKGATEITFTLPKPEGTLAFFRLKSGPPGTADAQSQTVSPELRYATIPSLATSP